MTRQMFVSSKFSKKSLIAFAIAFSVIGTVIILKAFGATPLAAFEPENATLSSAASACSDSSASGGKYVQFGGSCPGTTTTSGAYYVDCTSGQDTNDGKSQTAAWRSLSKANSVSLTSGNSLLFKKGCSFTGSLAVKWTNVTIGNYGAGNLPIITSNVDGTNIVNVSGTGNTIDGIQATAKAPSTDANCGNNPVGHMVGFNFPSGSANNTVKNSGASGGYAGVYLNYGSHNNHILNNQIIDNTMMKPLDTAAGNDAGAFGVLLWGNNNEIANNVINGSDACSYDYTRDGSAVEVYNGSSNNVHNNTALNDNTFTELGKDSSHSSDGNIYAYNQFSTNDVNGIFLNTRGSGNYGPITNTKAYNNVAYIGGSSSPGGVICSGCATNILTLKNNIIWDNTKAIYASGSFDESNNIYWSSNGSPLVQATISSTSKKADPRWANPGTDFHLQSGSPAINAGSNESLTAGFNKDLDGKAVPNGAGVDIGAYEL